MLEAIGKELKFTRERKNIKLEDAANSFKIHQETLRRYENNSSGLSVERLEKILKYYEVDINIFFRNVCEYMHEKNNQE